MSSSIVIFGGSGFLGRYAVQRLAATGARIIIPTRNVNAAQFLKSYGQVGQIVPTYWDRANLAALTALLHNASAVINLIGILYEKRRNDFTAIHQHWPAQLATAAQQAVVKRFIHVSAIGANAASPAAYARSKYAGEQAVLAAMPTATILRPSVVFGAEDNFLNLFASMACYSPFLPLIGGGQTRFQPVYVGDVAAAMVAALARPDSQGKIYELGGSQVYSFKELLALTLKIIKRRRCLLPLPWPVAKLQAAILQCLPQPLLTLDQVALLRSDNVVGAEALTLGNLGITPTALELIAPQYLARFVAR